jgi:peptidoglycan pentaglycine glycine transferase (the first glycine)
MMHLHPDGDAELFLVKLEPKPVLKELREELAGIRRRKSEIK